MSHPAYRPRLRPRTTRRLRVRPSPRTARNAASGCGRTVNCGRRGLAGRTKVPNRRSTTGTAIDAIAIRQPSRASSWVTIGMPRTKANVVAETMIPIARLRQTESRKSSRAPVKQFAMMTAEPHEASTRPTMSQPNDGASAETTMATSTTEPCRRSQARRLQRSIHGVAANADTTPTRELSVANCPVVASEVPNSTPIERSSGLRTAMFRRVTAAPKQSTTSPTHVRKVYLFVVSTLSPVVRIAIAVPNQGMVRPGAIGFRSRRDNEFERLFSSAAGESPLAMHVDRRAKRGPIPEEACVVEQKIDAAVAAGSPDRLLRPPPGEVQRVPEVGEVLREEHVVEPEEVLC